MPEEVTGRLWITRFTSILVYSNAANLLFAAKLAINYIAFYFLFVTPLSGEMEISMKKMLKTFIALSMVIMSLLILASCKGNLSISPERDDFSSDSPDNNEWSSSITPERDAQTSETYEGEGYPTAEDAVEAYITAMGKRDVVGMTKAFASETYIKSFNPDYIETDFRGVTLDDRVEEVVALISLQSSSLYILDMIRSGQLPYEIGDDLYDYSPNVAECNEVLSLVEIVEFVAPESLVKAYNSESCISLRQRRAVRYGADKIESIAAIVTVREREYHLLFDVICYSDRWYIQCTAGILASYLFLPPTFGGIYCENLENEINSLRKNE
jgi:hypothetical protein